jgi:hypothetical protein
LQPLPWWASLRSAPPYELWLIFAAFCRGGILPPANQKIFRADKKRAHEFAMVGFAEPVLSLAKWLSATLRTMVNFRGVL